MVTQGWIIVKGGSAQGSVRLNRDLALTPMQMFEAQNAGEGQGDNTEERKIIIVDMGLLGYTEHTDGRFWPRDQVAKPDDILNNIKLAVKHNTYVKPGVSFELIRQKIKEGFTIEFEDDEDRAKL